MPGSIERSVPTKIIRSLNRDEAIKISSAGRATHRECKKEEQDLLESGPRIWRKGRPDLRHVILRAEQKDPLVRVAVGGGRRRAVKCELQLSLTGVPDYETLRIRGRIIRTRLRPQIFGEGEFFAGCVCIISLPVVPAFRLATPWDSARKILIDYLLPAVEGFFGFSGICRWLFS